MARTIAPIWRTACTLVCFACQNLVQDLYCRARCEFSALCDGGPPEVFEDVAELMAHFQGDVVVDGVHAGHGVAAAVHLDDLVQVGGVEPGGVGVAVVVWLELADQVWPGGVGKVSCPGLLVALADREAGPGLGGDVDGAADAG